MKKQFNNEEILVWEQNASPLLLSLTLPDLKSLKSIFNLGHFTTIVIFENTSQAKWLFRKEECNLMGSKMIDILKNNTYRDNFRSVIKKCEKNLLKEIQNIEKKDLSNLTLEELLKLFNKLKNKFNDYFKYTVLVEPIEWYTEDLLNRYINSLSISKNEKKEMLQYLLKIESNCFSTDVMTDLNKCASLLDKFLKENSCLLKYNDSKVLTNKILNNEFSSNTYGELIDSLNNHVNKYYWKKNNYYQTKRLNIDDILEEILDTVYKKDFDYENMLLEIESNKISEIEKKRSYEKLLPNYLKNVVKISNEFGGKLGDDRKEIVMRTMGAVDKILNQVAKLTNTSLENIHLLIPQELDDYINNYKNYDERFTRRKKDFLIYHTDAPVLDEMTSKDTNKIMKIDLMNDPFIVEDEQVQEVLEKLNHYYNLFTESNNIDKTIKGTIVYKGDNSKIRGIVKIIKDPKKEQLSDNEILVATSTTPDFINAIHNSQAVITDWGGLTSHAAIITRELKKPCIVGTNYATSILNDNDEVEIDFETESVIILKKVGEVL